MNTTCQIITIEGRSFIIEWPYYGPDQHWLSPSGVYLRPCKIHGLARKGTKEAIIKKEAIKGFIYEARPPVKQ